MSPIELFITVTSLVCIGIGFWLGYTKGHHDGYMEACDDVPKEPTEEMIEAGIEVLPMAGVSFERPYVIEVYRAMILAAAGGEE